MRPPDDDSTYTNVCRRPVSTFDTLKLKHKNNMDILLIILIKINEKKNPD